MSKAQGDREIVALFFERSEEALVLTQKKHGKRILSICRDILRNEQDAEECVNRVLFTAWNSIPPEKPENLEAFLVFLARCQAIDRYREKKSQRRSGEEDALSFEELSDFFSADSDVEKELEQKELTRILERFLKSVRREERTLFIKRYYFGKSVDSIAKARGISRRKVYKDLQKLKEELKLLLREEGYLL